VRALTKKTMSTVVRTLISVGSYPNCFMRDVTDLHQGLNLSRCSHAFHTLAGMIAQAAYLT
jgi:hypothetical protein